MNRKTSGIIPVLLCLIATFLLVYILFGGCITSPTSDPNPEKPSVTVDATLLNFGESLDSLSFTVTLIGGQKEWSLSDDELPSWCTVTVAQQTNGSRVTVRVDRGELSPGEYKSSIIVKWDSGSKTVGINMIVPEMNNENGTIIIDVPLPEKEEIFE